MRLSNKRVAGDQGLIIIYPQKTDLRGAKAAMRFSRKFAEAVKPAHTRPTRKLR